MDNLGDRMKRYEAASQPLLPIRTPVVIRVDGRAFHTLTKDMMTFDDGLIIAMNRATIETAREMSGLKLAYTQSDEASFLIADTDTNETQPWFGNNLSKLISITASLFTYHFNKEYRELPRTWKIAAEELPGPAIFDARAFAIPERDVPNYFVWRQKDWERNSLNMLCSAHFSHRELHGKSNAERHEMLHKIGLNWADLLNRYKNGLYVKADKTTTCSVQPTYDAIRCLITPAPEPLTIPERNAAACSVEIPAREASGINFSHRPYHYMEEDIS